MKDNRTDITTNPYIIIKLECTEFYKDIVKR